MRKSLCLLILSASLMFGQAQAVNVVSGPPPYNWPGLFFYSGSNLIYACYAPGYSFSPFLWDVADSSLTNIVVAANVGTITFGGVNQTWPGMIIVVTGSTTPALNGTYKITGPNLSATSGVSGSTATIATSGVSNGTYTNAALVITTNVPPLNAKAWSINVLSYNATPSIQASYWAGLPSGPNVPQGLQCSNRANY